MRHRLSQRHHRDLPLRRRAAAHQGRRPKFQNQPPVNPLIVPRRVAAKMLSVSVSTLIRLQASHVLVPLKLTQANNAQTFYRLTDLQRLAQGGDHA
jgi:hypothetical protein